MIYLYIDGLEERLKSGMTEFAAEYNFGVADTAESCDIAITLYKTEEKVLSIERAEKNVKITYFCLAHIFRAIGLVLQNIDNKSYTSCEQVYFDETCVMMDVSQGNALPKIDKIYYTLRMLAAMGINTYMIYVEDCYEIKGEEYFGYMRPKYTYDDLKKIDDYAYALGIEVVPCMQTLGHLPNILRWSEYYEVKEDDTTLLVGEEKTYELIRKMLATSSAPFRSKRIHIGMDEAWRLGLGRYLTLNGYRNKHEIFSEHLERVVEIVKEMGLSPIMWGDMFFRSLLDNKYYTTEDVEFPENMLKSVPEGVEIVYWDYYSDAEVVSNMVKQNKKLEREIIFAGAVRNNRSFACKYNINTRTANIALPICKKNAIRKVMATVWSDNCPESFFYTALLGIQLYAEHTFSAVVEKDKWHKRFEFCAKADAEAFESTNLFDEVPGVGEETNLANVNTSKVLLWQDILLGLFDENIKDIKLDEHYAGLAKRFVDYAEGADAFKQLFEFYAAAAEALSKKSMLGVRLYNAYNSNKLAEVRNEIDEAIASAEKLYYKHRQMWMDNLNPVGWEVLDIRYGAMLRRLKTAAERVDDYLAGKIKSIPELEEKRLLYNGREGIPCEYEYPRIVSASKL